MTNIVSPGFAPLEQYHSKGNQCLETALYSLGAVVCSMATERKPMEPASRVPTDDLPKAYGNARTVLFGDALRRAIVRALAPDDALLPQNVAAFRKALQEAQRIGTQTIVGGTTRASPKLGRTWRRALGIPSFILRPIHSQCPSAALRPSTRSSR